MANLAGTNLAAPVVPFTTEDIYATHEAKYGKGGWRTVATIAERNAITSNRKEAGMAVFVLADKKIYILQEDLTWKELVADPSGFKTQVITEFPTENIDTKTLYFKASDDPKENNIYNEFLYINNTWEQVGSTAIDISGKQDVISDLDDIRSGAEAGATALQEETDPVFSASPAASITNDNIEAWNNKSDFSGSYNDLSDTPVIPIVPTNLSSFIDDLGDTPTHTHSQYLTEHQDLSGKQDVLIPGDNIIIENGIISSTRSFIKWQDEPDDEAFE